MKKPMKLSEVLSQNLRKSLGEDTTKGLDMLIVCRKCKEVLGPTISSYINDVSFANGELRIRVSSAVLKNDLFMQRTHLIEKVNAALGSPIVRTIYIQ